MKYNLKSILEFVLQIFESLFNCASLLSIDRRSWSVPTIDQYGLNTLYMKT